VSLEAVRDPNTPNPDKRFLLTVFACLLISSLACGGIAATLALHNLKEAEFIASAE
jgi:hypothetical protein